MSIFLDLNNKSDIRKSADFIIIIILFSWKTGHNYGKEAELNQEYLVGAASEVHVCKWDGSFTLYVQFDNTYVHYKTL